MLFRSIIAMTLGFLVLLASPGCASGPYDNRYTYEPRPVTVETQPRDEDVGPVRALATVVGIRRADDEQNLPASVHVRLRLDNNADAPARFDPRSLELFSADVEQFPAPTLEPDEPLTFEPGETAIVDAYFPLPANGLGGDTDFSGLSVRWDVGLGDRTLPASATFNRQRRDYYDSYRDRSRFNVGFGYGYHRW